MSGVVYAPNGTDPLPNVTVYIPDLSQPIPLPPFATGVSCPVSGALPAGNPIAGTITAVNGAFTIPGVPVGTTIPVVAVSGKWRVQTTVTTTACGNTTVNLTMPSSQAQGDIPKIAILTGDADQVECVLIKMGMQPSEFTAPGGGGSIQLYVASPVASSGNSGGGAYIGTESAADEEPALMSNINNYDVVMLPCEGEAAVKSSSELSDFTNFVNAGGRVYASHYSYEWLYQNGDFANVAAWDPKANDTENSGIATVNTSFSDGQTLAQWLALPQVGAAYATTPAVEMQVNEIKHDIDGVNSPTQAWLTYNGTIGGILNPVMQFVFDTPIGATNQCGRVLYNEYHVEDETNSSGMVFNPSNPSYCYINGTTMTGQEKLLEYSLFELTNDGGQPTMTPTSAAFGSEAIGATTAPQTFTWTNNSSFLSGVTSATASGDFSVTGNGCTTVAANSSCSITVVFTPTALGARTGTLTVVGGSGSTLTAALTGTGIVGFSMTPASLTFGSLPIGVSATQSLTLTNNAPTALTTPPFTTTGDYAVATNCGTSIAGNGTCSVNVTFTPTAVGVRTGTLSSNESNLNEAGLTASLTGTGIDGLALSPTTLTFGSQDVGASTTQALTLTNVSSSTLPVPVFTTTGDYSVASTCGSALAANSTCALNITFTPTTSGARPGTLSVNSSNAVYANLAATFTGTGIDFTLTLNPTSGTVIAGNPAKTTATLAPLAGFSAPVTLTCTLTAPGSTCTLADTTQVPASTANLVTITTTSEYTVIGYTGIGTPGWLWLVAAVSGLALWWRRRNAGKLMRAALLMLMLAALGGSVTGCSAKQPAKNADYTTPGPYTYTITATDGFLVHTATYTLNVTAD